MKCRLSHMLRCGLLLLVGFSFAQNGDTVLQSYGLAVERLNKTVNLSVADGPASAAALDQAAQTLRTLSRDTSSPSLITALERTFARAETAIQNQSATDLGVQVAVLRGGFWRLVYESALRAANEGDLALSRERLVRVAADMAFDSSSLDTLRNTDTFPELITAFDTGAAAITRARLEASAAADNQDAAYLALAGAYAHLLPVQDSPRVSAAAANYFSEAFQALVNDEPDTFQTSLAALDQTLSDFQNAAALALQGAAQPQNAPQTTTEALPEAASSLDVLPSEASVTPAAPTDGLTAETAAQGVTVQDSAVQDVVVQDVAVQDVEATPSPTVSVPLLDTADAELRTALAAFELDEARRDELVNTYLASQFRSVDDATEALYADSSRLLSATESGDTGAVQSQLEAYRDTFERFLAPLLGPNSAVSADTRQLLNHFETAPGLRLQDGAVLVDQTDRVARALAGDASSTSDLLLQTSLLWSGWPRLLVMLVLGLLAIIPLYLLNLAFGGANRNWRLIGVALFLLLLPIMYEGLSSLLELLANLSGVGALGTLATFSIFQNTLSQVVWAALSALAIFLAVAGLYGICVQFGLLGKRSANDTIISSKDTALGRTSTNSAIDWDEEF